MTYAAGPFKAAEVGGELFLLHADSGDSYRIGGAGPRFWQLLVAGTAPDEVARQVAEEAGAPLERVRADLDGFVAEMERIGALVRSRDA